MKAVLLEIPEPIRRWMDERARLGHDRHDEMWDGVLHMVPPPSSGHQIRESRLIVLLTPEAERRGLQVTVETGLFRPGRDDDYRVPDVLVWSPQHLSERGVEGRTELAVELRSPRDEAWEKLPFFAEMGVPEVLIVEAQGAVLLRLDVEAASYQRVEPDADGWLALECIEAAFRTEPDGGLGVRTTAAQVVL
jgi:Uma2 family endonuclease